MHMCAITSSEKKTFDNQHVSLSPAGHKNSTENVETKIQPPKKLSRTLVSCEIFSVFMQKRLRTAFFNGFSSPS
jgi:hypothetical protein